MSNLPYRLPTPIIVDGYKIDLSAGATTNQVLQYNGTSFIAATASSGIQKTDLWYSVVDAANIAGGSSIGGNFTVGMRIRVTAAVTMTGARFYWSGANKTIKCSLFSSAGTNVANGTVTTTGTGIYTVTFGSPFSISGSNVYNTFYSLGMWDNSSSVYQNMTTTNLAFPWSSASATNNTDNIALISPILQVVGNNFFIAGDAAPTSGGPAANNEYYPIEPVYTVP